MGNNCKRCFGIHTHNKGYARPQYNLTKDFSIEFEQLMDNELVDDIMRPSSDAANTPFTVSNYMRWLSAQEEALRDDDEGTPQPDSSTSGLSRGGGLGNQFSLLCTPGGRGGADGGGGVAAVSDWVLRDNWSTGMGSEEELDNAELSRVVEGLRDDQLGLTMAMTVIPAVVAGGVTKAGGGCRPTSVTARIHQLAPGLGDVNSPNSTKEMPSLDLDWDHEPGMNPSLALKHERSATEEDLRRMAESGKMDSSSSEEYLWEHDDFVNPTTDKRHLLADS